MIPLNYFLPAYLFKCHANMQNKVFTERNILGQFSKAPTLNFNKRR